MSKRLRTMTPVEIDTAIAGLHQEALGIQQKLDYATDRVLTWAGLRHYERPTRWGAKGRYVTTGTYEDALPIVHRMWEQEQAHRASNYAEATRPEHWGNHDRNIPFEGPQETLDKRDALRASKLEVWAKINTLQAEYARRGGWPRYYVVTSSAGHIHSDTRCQTCRITTTFGWLPEMSGQTEAEAIAALGRHAEALCSVCFPTAPVAAKRAHITPAKAKGLSAGTVATFGE